MSHPEHSPSTGTTIHQRRTRQQQQRQAYPKEGGQLPSSHSQAQAQTQTQAAIGLGVIPPTPTREQAQHQHQHQQHSHQRVTLPPIRIPDIDHYGSRPNSSSSAGGLYPHQHGRSSPAASASADPYTGIRHLPHPISSPGLPQYLPSSATNYFHHPHLSLSTSTSPLSIDGRVLRSPHPPLTALLNPVGIDHVRSSLASQDQYRASHFLAQQQQQQQQHLNPYHHEQGQNSHLRPTHQLHRSYHTLSPLDHPLASPSFQTTFTAPPHLPPASSSAPSRASPVLIPPPLRFNYSATPPELNPLPSPNPLPDYSDGNARSSTLVNSDASLRAQYFPEFLIPAMPPRRKAAGGAAAATGNNTTVSSTPHTVSSATSSSRPRKGVKGNGWTMEHTYDSVGQKKEVIVIDDSQTPEHAPRKRTRAQVAAENAAAAAAAGGSGGPTRSHGSQNGHLPNGYAPSVASTSSAGKKRKVDAGVDTAAKKKGKASGTAASTQTAPRAPPVQPVPPNQPNTWDDAEGHFIVKPEDIIGSKYKIVRLLGQGTFGKVVEARHIESRRKVAIKVIRAVQKYRDASKIEIRVLETLKAHDPANSFKCIHLDEYFDYRNHPCIVSELYGMSVFDFLKQNGFSPFPERHIQDFAHSLLKSVAFLHRLRLVHTDLKPENILLVSNGAELAGPRRAGAKSRAILRNTDIRLIDFGSATFENEYHSSVVSTRHYRAPEIILGLPWSYPCDMFSIGCILVEFFTGDALFQTHDNLEHLAMMEVVMGRMPSRMVDKGRLKKPEFFKSGKIDFPNSTVSRSSRKYVKNMKSLAEIIPPTNSHNKLFLDLIERLLDFDPDSRLTVDKALDHPYLRVQTPEPLPAA